MIISENDKIQDIISGLETAYIDSNINSNLAYRPEFISNDYKKGKKVLVSIENELRKCDEFSISVAFITMSGITPLLQILKELEEKNIPGKILTTNYLNFSEPEALSKLSELKNIELKMFYHIIISFVPRETTEEIAFDIAERFAKEYLKDEYEVHNDKDYMHAHLIFNSVNLVTGMKYK